MTTCPHCAAEVAAGLTRCPECGHELQPSAPAAVAPPTRMRVAGGLGCAFLAALLALLGIVLLFGLLAGGLLGCSHVTPDPLPDTPPAMTGLVTRVEIAAGPRDRIASVLIEEHPDSPDTGQKASVAITRQTAIYREGAGGPVRAGVEALRNGLRARVWFVGPVLESYPVQATAGTIVVAER